MSINAKACVGSHDIVFLTLDTLRYDVAMAALDQGDTPNLANILPQGIWERRHSPGSFTYAAHHSFFSGFLPTPTTPGPHERLFAAHFPGSETTGRATFTFENADIVSGLAREGYHTICIGGVGFFNKQTALGRVLPSLFSESWWEEKFGVTDPNSTAHQVQCALTRLAAFENQRVFLFINISACHQPNKYYIPGATADSPETQRASLAYVDSQLPPLLQALRKRAPTLLIICADHGTAYGEEGYVGHRVAHPVVWDVPYAELILPKEDGVP